MKKLFTLALCLLMVLTSVLALADGLGVVTTKYGQVSGVSGVDYTDVTIYKSIPYAKPPVGELRWAAPQDPEAWEGVLACDTYKPAAIMPSYVNEVMNPASQWGEFYPYGVPEMSEDCLYLNVATIAENGDEKLPVLVWFHGGNIAHGYSYEEEFNPEALADKGIIVVTVGHRLNVFGLLSLPQLTAESAYGGSGNYTLMDCTKAINWVYENIEAFGGDPSRITVGGQSGGSSKTTACLVSPLTDGQIYGTYNMSTLNPYSTYATQADAEAAGLKLLAALGMDENTPLSEIRALTVEQLIAAYDEVGLSNGFCIDGYSLVENAADYYLRAGALDGLNMMFGHVFGESGSFGATTPEELYAAIRETYGNELCDKYDLENTLEVTEENVALLNYQLKEAASQANNRLFAVDAAKRNEDLNVYGFSFGRTTPGSEIGWHSEELWYFFASLRDVEWQTVNRPWQVWDYITAETASGYWANFIATGDPNGRGLAEWPAVTAENGMAIQFIDYSPYTMEGVTSFDKIVMEAGIEKYQLNVDLAELF